MKSKCGFMAGAALALTIFGASAARAEDSAVLDFEADVIEGELRKPDLFVQTGSGDLSLDSVIYGRADFNDFHAVDGPWRGRYVDAPAARKPAPPAQGGKK